MNRQMWIRLGVVLSVAWIVVGWFAFNHFRDEHSKTVFPAVIERCPNKETMFTDIDNMCIEDATRAKIAWDQATTTEVIKTLAIGLVAGWVGWGFVLLAGNWVLGARRPRST